MTKTVGQVIRKGREKKGFTRPELAKKLKISIAYLGHLECDHPVTFSERLQLGSARTLGVPLRTLSRLAEPHNRKARRWYSNYRKRQSK